MGKCRECFTRARHPEEIAQRREEILAAAMALLEQNSLDQISLNAVAREAGLAKSAVYRYFESREAIFLKILERDFHELVSEIGLTLEELKGSDDPAKVASALVAAIIKHPRLCQLISSLASVLEQNLTEEALINFKRESLQIVMRMVVALAAALPSVPANEWPQFVNPAIALIAGLWPLSHPSKTVQKVMARPEFEAMKPDFETQLRNTFHMALLGMQQAAKVN